MNFASLLAQSGRCCHKQCMQQGKWLPVLVVRLVGQTVMEKPVTVGIPIKLCEKHKLEFEPASALTFMGKAQLTVQVAMRRGRKINWDTLTVEWRTDKDADRVVTLDNP